MKLATFRTESDPQPRAGEVRDDAVVAFDDGTTVLDRLTTGDRTPAGGEAFALAGVTLLAPHVPRAIFCIGWNYKAHIEETGRELPEYPVVFLKLPASAAPPNGVVRCPKVVRRLDYECELTVVMGADGAVAGYTVADDVSGRDLQKREPQWTRAKGADTFCPFGPWVTTADEVPEPENLRLRTWVNGDLRQDSRTNDLLFGIEYLLGFISETCTLSAGDLILTGTPSGVGMAMDPPRFLEDGDVVRMEIESLGTIEHRIEAASG
jgi:2-keto-4-pentenoate hydratase/2-oxohepta-3-ene-1,7-dioic acid hydratase in catechol pathway